MTTIKLTREENKILRNLNRAEKIVFSKAIGISKDHILIFQHAYRTEVRRRLNRIKRHELGAEDELLWQEFFQQTISLLGLGVRLGGDYLTRSIRQLGAIEAGRSIGEASSEEKIRNERRTKSVYWMQMIKFPDDVVVAFLPGGGHWALGWTEDEAQQRLRDAYLPWHAGLTPIEEKTLQNLQEIGTASMICVEVRNISSISDEVFAMLYAAWRRADKAKSKAEVRGDSTLSDCAGAIDDIVLAAYDCRNSKSCDPKELLLAYYPKREGYWEGYSEDLVWERYSRRNPSMDEPNWVRAGKLRTFPDNELVALWAACEQANVLLDKTPNKDIRNEMFRRRLLPAAGASRARV